MVLPGFVIPRGHCGYQYIIFYVDDTNRIAESSDSNNIATTHVFVACDDGKMSFL